MAGSKEKRHRRICKHSAVVFSINDPIKLKKGIIGAQKTYTTSFEP
jgi:hypothetical protein